MLGLLDVCLTFCVFRLFTLKKKPALSFAYEIKSFFIYGIGYSLMSIIITLIFK